VFINILSSFQGNVSKDEKKLVENREEKEKNKYKKLEKEKKIKFQKRLMRGRLKALEEEIKIKIVKILNHIIFFNFFGIFYYQESSKKTS